MNTLKASITSIERSGTFALISLSCLGKDFFALIVDHSEEYISAGNTVYMAFKETELSIGKNIQGELSIRNRFPSVVTAIHKDLLLSEITMDFKGQLITSVITTSSCERLQLEIGSAIEGLLKTTEMMLMKYE